MRTLNGIVIDRGLHNVDWAVLKRALAEDKFDNGRTPDELARSFAASTHTVLARLGSVVVGTARMLADGVCNAYLVDVWTAGPYRGRGIATAMVEDLVARVPGHHVALFTDSAAAFYARLGFTVEREGMSRISGAWLRR